jgi:hypothetical protein
VSYNVDFAQVWPVGCGLRQPAANVRLGSTKKKSRKWLATNINLLRCWKVAKPWGNSEGTAWDKSPNSLLHCHGLRVGVQVDKTTRLSE